MTKNETYKGPESMITAAREAIDLIGNSNTTNEMQQNTIKGMTLARCLIDLIERNILYNIEEIQRVNCPCPVCAVAQKKIKEEAQSISTLQKIIEKPDLDEQNDPFGTIILLNTISILLVHIPKLIVTMSEMVSEAHEMGVMLIKKKIANLHLETKDDDESCCNCGICERPDKTQN